MKLIKLMPKVNAKYHFGEFGLEDSSFIFHSDSLFSAIFNNYVKLYGSDDKDIDKLKSIKISSLLPAYSDVFFVPKPLTRLNFDEKGQKRVEDKPKEIKNIEFVSLNALKDHNEGGLRLEDEDETNKDKKILIINKKFLITKKDKTKLMNKGIDLYTLDEQKIAIDRSKGTVSEGQLFSVGYIKPEGMYFYFILDDSNLDNETQKKLHTAIRLIQDEGLGGKRSAGAGLFESVEFCEHSDFEDYIKSNSDKKYYMSISLTLPKDEEEFKKCKAYNLIERRGYIYHPIQMTKRKKSIMMLSEGSIFSNNVEGKIADVAPENSKYKVFKFGKFFGIPINVKSDENV